MKSLATPETGSLVGEGLQASLKMALEGALHERGELDGRASFDRTTPLAKRPGDGTGAKTSELARNRAGAAVITTTSNVAI